MKIRDICLMAVMGVVLNISKFVIAYIPNIELVSLFIILFTLVFKWRAIGAVAVFVFLEGLLYGFGLWWIMYLYSWPILILITWIFRWLRSNISWAILSGIYGLSFGFLTSFVYFALGGFATGVSYFIGGLTFDIAHCAGNFLLMLLLYNRLRPMLEKLNKSLIGA